LQLKLLTAHPALRVTVLTAAKNHQARAEFGANVQFHPMEPILVGMANGWNGFPKRFAALN
jgi:hypothetical protein